MARGVHLAEHRLRGERESGLEPGAARCGREKIRVHVIYNLRRRQGASATMASIAHLKGDEGGHERSVVCALEKL